MLKRRKEKSCWFISLEGSDRRDCCATQAGCLWHLGFRGEDLDAYVKVCNQFFENIPRMQLERGLEKRIINKDLLKKLKDLDFSHLSQEK